MLFSVTVINDMYINWSAVFVGGTRHQLLSWTSMSCPLNPRFARARLMKLFCELGSHLQLGFRKILQPYTYLGMILCFANLETKRPGW